MAQLYKADKSGNIIDESGNIILKVVPVNCSNKYMRKAAAILANTLFMVERGEQCGKKNIRKSE